MTQNKKLIPLIFLIILGSNACFLSFEVPEPGDDDYAEWYCGNGVLDETEVCDDGNQDDGDGCNSICRVEEGYKCINTNGLYTCHLKCGDGVKDDTETCDDGNIISGDGCSAACIIE